MTTVACDGKTLAADSMTSAGGQLVGYQPKVKRTPDGRVFACCGPSADGIKFARWLCDGGEEPKLTDDFSAMVLTPEGRCFTTPMRWRL